VLSQTNYLTGIDLNKVHWLKSRQ